MLRSEAKCPGGTSPVSLASHFAAVIAANPRSCDANDARGADEVMTGEEDAPTRDATATLVAAAELPRAAADWWEAQNVRRKA